MPVSFAQRRFDASFVDGAGDRFPPHLGPIVRIYSSVYTQYVYTARSNPMVLLLRTGAVHIETDL